MKSFTLKFALTFLLGVGLASAAVAQKIGGTVKDSAGKPVVGASVIVEGSTLGASSGVDGQWSLNVPDASKKTLVISYIGMKTQRIAIGSKTQIDVTLEDESTAMDDVVVVGYATVKRRDVVGSVASVNAETLQQMPVASVAEAMTGRMAGVQITATEGDPDAEIRIRVRGAGTFSSDGAPLYIVDGFPVESISDISSSEIQSIDILKDAFSTAIYGSRGANGVVLITTKSGEKGKVNVNYNVYWGFKDIARKNQVQALNPSEFAKWQYELAAIQNKAGEFVPKIKLSENTEKITNPGNKTFYRIYEKETGKIKADYICFVEEELNPENDLLLFDPAETWKKTKLKGGTYKVREMLQPVFLNGKCVYESPSIREIAAYCKQEKDTLWDETKRLFYPHQVYVDLSDKLYKVKQELLNKMSMTEE